MRVRYVVVVVVVLVVAVALIGAYVLVGPRGDVDDPKAATSPGDVVRAYLDAGKARDLSTMRAIVEDSREEHFVPGYGDILLRTNMVVGDVEVGTVSPTAGEGTTADGWEQIVRVPVKFHIIQSDGSFASDDRTVWGYLLVRHHDDEPWQIVDQGVV